MRRVGLMIQLLRLEVNQKKYYGSILILSSLSSSSVRFSSFLLSFFLSTLSFLFNYYSWWKYIRVFAWLSAVPAYPFHMVVPHAVWEWRRGSVREEEGKGEKTDSKQPYTPTEWYLDYPWRMELLVIPIITGTSPTPSLRFLPSLTHSSFSCRPPKLHSCRTTSPQKWRHMTR